MTAQAGIPYWRRILAKPQKIGSIEIAQDLEFQRRSWKVQRVGWTLMLLVIIAGLLGLFGRGPLSSAELGGEGSSLRVDYERFLRVDAPAKLTLYVDATAVRPDSTVEIWLDRTWLAAMFVKAIIPEPERTQTGASHVSYTFRVHPSSMPARITYELETQLMGRIRGRVGVLNGPSYSFSQFAYP